MGRDKERRQADLRWRYLSLGVGILLFLTGCVAPDPSLLFVQITDTHFGSGENTARSAAAVEQINALSMPIACVIHTGDLLADNIVNETVLITATSTLGRIQVPYHVLPGNHDILRRNLTATLNIYTNRVGPLCATAEYHGVVFLLLYDDPLRLQFNVEGYDPLNWLKTALKKAGRKPVIVCLHSPPVDDFYNNAVHPGWPPEIRARFERLVNAARVKAVIAGHFHRDELRWLGRVPIYVAPAIADYWGRQGAFRIYEYRRGRLSYRTVYLDDTLPAKTPSVATQALDVIQPQHVP